MDIHLEGIQIDMVVIHIGVNNLLNYSNQLRTDSLMNNIICMAEKKLQLWCLKCFFVWHNFHDEDKFVYFNIISNFCSTSRLYYIDNRNIRADFLYKDGLQFFK